MTGPEEIKYRLTFPGGRPDADEHQQQRAASSGPEDFVFVYEEEKRPLVVLLGWAGCQDKYLAKYSAIYEERR